MDLEQNAELDKALQEVFCERHLAYLASRQYDATDVVSWVWIVKSNTVYEAISRIFIFEANQRSQHGAAAPGIPPFIPLLLLRQPTFDAKTFRLVLIYSLHLMSGQPLPSLHSINPMLEKADPAIENPSSIDPSMCMTFVVRLLRHARRVWPQAQFSIARAFARYLTCSIFNGKSSENTPERMNRFRADKFNACLWLLSLPSKPGPFTSASIQQQAQFELLRAMAGHKPVLPVTRRGYQGVIATQLAHKKTPAERQSAALKAPSWPPWKEEKLGIDSHRGNEGMKSRAMRVMSQMMEAGYSLTRLEEVTSIFAGWDTDHSPTIQTRTLMCRPQSLPGPLGSKPNHQAIWAARIRATRTVREAWACFLSYQDQGLSPRLSIYAAMAEKLIYRRKAFEGHFDEVSGALPGDGLEVFPEPSSARDLIYVHTEPPTLDELLRQMLAQGIRPSGKLLGLLLRTATSFSSGLDYLSCSDLSNRQIEILCTVREYQSDYNAEEQKAVAALPDKLFSSFIGFLCRFSNFDPLHRARHDIRAADIFPIVLANRRATIHSQSTLFLFSQAEGSGNRWDLHHPRTLSHAVQLVKLRSSQHPSSWIQLLSALSKDRISIPYRELGRSAQRVIGWHEVLEVAGWMERRRVEPGLYGFHILCSAFSKAVAAGVRHPSAAEEGLGIVNEVKRAGNLSYISTVCSTFEDMVQVGLLVLKSHFDRLVLPDPQTSHLVEGDFLDNAPDSQATVPRMLHIPSPAVLHGFVRALGLAEDYNGLLNFLRWMSQCAGTLKEASDEYLNGGRMMRRTLVATRVFLEGPPWGKHSLWSLDGPEELVFLDPTVHEAYDIITATSVWGSWPSDEEVWEYVHWET